MIMFGRNNKPKPDEREKRQAKLAADLDKVLSKLDATETEVERLLRRAETIAREVAEKRLLIDRYVTELDRERATTVVADDTITALVTANKLLLSRMDADMAVQSARQVLAQPTRDE